MNRAVRIVTLAAAAAAGLVACSLLRGTPSRGSLIFSHARHLKEGVDCDACHAEVAKSQAIVAGKYLPKMKACGDCHDIVDKSKCTKCHRGAYAAAEYSVPERHLKFAHARHQEVKCATCHPQGKEAAALIPGHPTCNTSGCHQKTYRTLECQRCHQDLQRYGVRPIAYTLALGHGPRFVRDHGVQARQSAKACVQCHDQTFCAGCHARTGAATLSALFPEEVDRSFIHRGDFLTRHQIEARSDPALCYKCHGQAYCRACHALDGTAAPTQQAEHGGISRNPHPAGWMIAGSRTFHGREARRDIGRCASCHDRGAQSNCVGCHQVGGVGGSPHPAGWRRRAKAEECRSSAVCAACHPGAQGCP